LMNMFSPPPVGLSVRMLGSAWKSDKLNSSALALGPGYMLENSSYGRRP
jgi:hypothetical protein